MVPLTCGRKSVISEQEIGFVVFPKVLLKKTSVGSTPGPVFGPNNDHYIRFAFSAKTVNMKKTSELIEKFD